LRRDPELLDRAAGQRHAVAGALVRRQVLELAGNEDFRVPFGARQLLQLVDDAVRMVAIGLDVSEGRDVDGGESRDPAMNPPSPTFRS